MGRAAVVEGVNISLSSRTSNLVLPQDLRPLLVSLAFLACYCVAPAIAWARISPPFFFTVGLALAAAALRPTVGVSIAAAASAIAATLFLALDHIVSMTKAPFVY